MAGSTFIRKYQLLFFLLAGSVCFSQTKKIDSLKNVLTQAKEDTNKVVTLNVLSRYLLNIGSYPPADSFADQAFVLAEKLKYEKGFAKAITLKGIIRGRQGDYGKALELHYKSLEINLKNDDKGAIANNYTNLGVIYQYLGNYPVAL